MEFNTKRIKDKLLLHKLGESTRKWLESEEGQAELSKAFKEIKNLEPLYKPIDPIRLQRRITI